MKHIKNTLDKFLLDRELYEILRGRLTLLKWEEIVGEKLAKYTQPISYKDKTITVGVTSSMFVNDLNYMKGDIIEKIKEVIPDSPVQDINFRVVERVTSRNRAKEKPSTKVVLDDEDRKWIDSMVVKLNVNKQLKKQYRDLLTQYRLDQKLKTKNGYKKCEKCGALFKGRVSLCPVCVIEGKKY